MSMSSEFEKRFADAIKRHHETARLCDDKEPDATCQVCFPAEVYHGLRALRLTAGHEGAYMQPAAGQRTEVNGTEH